jgi:hypothetical protein
MEIKKLTQAELAKKALKELLSICYMHNLQHGCDKRKAAMENAEIVLKQPKVKIKALKYEK